MLKGPGYLSNEFFLVESKQHAGEVVVDVVDGAVGEEGDHAADVGKHPHDTNEHHVRCNSLYYQLCRIKEKRNILFNIYT